MDFTIQKTAELGVSKIIPLFTEKSTIKLSDDKHKKWNIGTISEKVACEQCEEVLFLASQSLSI